MIKIRSIYYLSVSFTALSIKVNDKTVIKNEWDKEKTQIINETVVKSIESRDMV